jgi:RNA-directed DNA polymerase
VLDELDRELERRGHGFVRCAHDRNIYVRGERAGQRVMESFTRFIAQKLKLKVNEAKSAVARAQQRKFLGFGFTDGPEVKRAIAPKALDRFKRRIREITRRATGVSVETTIAELAPCMRGWPQLFQLLRNARGADKPHPLDPIAASHSSVAAVENSPPSPGRVDCTGGGSTTG